MAAPLLYFNWVEKPRKDFQLAPAVVMVYNGTVGMRGRNSEGCGCMYESGDTKIALYDFCVAFSRMPFR